MRGFYEKHVKGNRAYENHTTADMYEIIKDITREQKVSYCEYLRTDDASITPEDLDAMVGTADIFVSHAWKYNFYEFLCALEARFGPNVKLWIDIFCHNQHEELSSDDWINNFETHVKRMKSTVMIVFPWNNPIPLTR